MNTIFSKHNALFKVSNCGKILLYENISSLEQLLGTVNQLKNEAVFYIHFHQELNSLALTLRKATILY